MFLKKTLEQNKRLIETGFQLHQNGAILPDTYVIDVDQFIENAKKIYEQARQQNIVLYFMLKQVGRNPYLAKELVKIGYQGAVVVDFREAQVMMDNQIPISNVGHLVQPPYQMLQALVDYKCEYFTAFSISKIRDINECAKQSNVKQKILLKVVDEDDIIYSGQSAGFKIDELNAVVDEIKELSNIVIAGVTAFPCFLYNEEKHGIQATNNLSTLYKAQKILEAKGIEIENINAPSTTSVTTLKQMKDYNISSAEPGHGLSGSTPLHAFEDCVEKPCVIYVSEVSHLFHRKTYCYGGGFYRRSHVTNAFIGTSINKYITSKVISPSLESIDYYFGLEAKGNVNDTVIMAFRFQIFVTRSNVVLIKGLSENKSEIVGLYSSQGDKIG